MTIQANQMGDVRKDYNKPVAASQTIKRGDPLVIAAGVMSKGAIGALLIEGFACHDVTTGATVNAATDRVIYNKATEQEFRGDLKPAQATPTDGTLEGTDVGLIFVNGLTYLDPAATVKQLTIVKVPEPYDRRRAQVVVKAAYRQGLV